MGKAAMKRLELIPVTIKSLILSVLVLLKLGAKLERLFEKSFHIHNMNWQIGQKDSR